MSPAERLRLEKLTAGNAPVAAVLHAKCFPRGWPVEDFRRYAEDRNCHGVIARLGSDDAVGLAVVRIGGDEGEILTIATDPSYRRKGIARNLLASIVDELSDGALTVLFLEVGVTNEAAIALYKSCGFEPVGKRTAYYHHADGREDALIMRHFLG